MWSVANALASGPMPVPDAIARCEELIRYDPADRALTASREEAVKMAPWRMASDR
jgi:hypothetical protein